MQAIKYKTAPFKRTHAIGRCCDRFYMRGHTARNNNHIDLKFAPMPTVRDCLMSVITSHPGTIWIHWLDKDHKRAKFKTDQDILWLGSILSHESIHCALDRLGLLEASYALDVLHDHEAARNLGHYTDTGLALGTLRRLKHPDFMPIKAGK